MKIFKDSIRQGPYYICVVCNRSLYKRSVRLFDENKYEVRNELFLSRVSSYDGKEYICLTCHFKLLKKNMPCQAVYNKLQNFELPREFADLRKLEKVIIAKRLLYKRIAIMRKGHFQKLQVLYAMCL